MTTIGTFHKSGDDYLGEVITLSVQAKNVRISPDTPANVETGPTHRIFVGRAEIGAAWTRRSAEGREYLSITLDDPSFSAPINANLVETKTGFSLIWSRRQEVTA
ncbi:DUF736 domain-containing protein [uncultured Brevundimonas sp.]|uniref:DUF736 domain-containing protein n=1 Tax=uncultured Brevundimonas sp. TaxID=213418 RepID=UPI0025FBADF9|nr:DUF736 domain-containing protein [uncultured Brevundimonas sp.]